MTKKLVWVAVALVFMVGGGIYAYANEAAIFDRFYPSEAQVAREERRFARELPPTIGNYALQTNYPNKAVVRHECEEAVAPLCYKSVRAVYGEMGGYHEISLFFLEIESGNEDTLRAYVAKENPRFEKLGQYPVFFLEEEELGWFTTGKYSAVGTDEDVYMPDGQGTTDYVYTNKVGDNPVTQYFLEKYPPVP